jgi:xylulokinase
MSLLGVDLGTSSCKAVAFSDSGAVLASASAAYSRRGADDEGCELDASVFWDAFVGSVRKTAQAVGGDPIRSLAISSHGETIIPLDARNATCGPALLNRDNRSASTISDWEAHFGRQVIYRITGQPVHAMYSLPKILWLRRNRPDIFAASRRFVSVADFLLVKLGLPAAIDYTMASRTMGFDIEHLKWSGELLEFAGLKPDHFSDPAPSGTPVGRLGGEAARTLSLEEGTLVALGGHDQPCGAFGAGCADSGCAVDSAGSYECVTLVADEPRNGSASLGYSLNSYPHVVGGKYVVLAFFPSGLVIDWALGNFYAEGISKKGLTQGAYDAVQRKVEELGREPTGICVTPHLLGSDNPHWDMRATLSMSGLRAGHGRYHLYKALYEGIACELGDNLRVLQEVSGPITRLMIFGGGARWDLGVQIRADIAGMRMERIAASESVCRGAAMLAGIGSGVYRDFDEAIAGTKQATEIFYPLPRSTKSYEVQMRRYAALYEGLERYRSLEALGLT